MVDEWDAQDDARRIGTRDRTIGEDFGIEQPLLMRLPDEDFETGTWLAPRVDRYSQVTVRTNRYSVPVRLVGRQVRVQLHASHLVVYDGREQVAWHERLMAKAGSRLDLDHYLEALVRKPGALPGATALEQARAAGRFTPVHDARTGPRCGRHPHRRRRPPRQRRGRVRPRRRPLHRLGPGVRRHLRRRATDQTPVPGPARQPPPAGVRPRPGAAGLQLQPDHRAVSPRPRQPPTPGDTHPQLRPLPGRLSEHRPHRHPHRPRPGRDRAARRRTRHRRQPRPDPAAAPGPTQHAATDHRRPPRRPDHHRPPGTHR
jgi:Mu transposase, C-terminal domain